GGVVLARDSQHAEAARQVRTHGSTERYVHDRVGGNFRIHALQAAILRLFLPHLRGWIEARRACASRYRAGLAGVEGIVLPKEYPGSEHTYHQFTLRVPEGRRESLRAFLAKREIATAVYYPLCCHLQKAVSAMGYTRGSFPVAEAMAEEV